MILPFNSRKKSHRYLKKLLKSPISAADVTFLYSASEYYHALLQHIITAQKRVCLVALYLENDEAGKEIISHLYQAKAANPALEITVVVDLHRAQRGRIGQEEQSTNADFYYHMAQQHPDLDITIYGIPVNTREIFGVLHLKGSIIDDSILYTGASFNNIYLHVGDRYRADRYHVLHHAALADEFYRYVTEVLLSSEVAQPLNQHQGKINIKAIRAGIRHFRRILSQQHYQQAGFTENKTLSYVPIVGLGRANELNVLIKNLFQSTENKLVLCTPYFNFPVTLRRSISFLLKAGKQVEIIVADKTANDFYIPENEPFKTIGGLPYFYEKNLRLFIRRFQRFIDNGLLTIRLWKDGSNSFHLKGIWVDDKWMMITGNNLNPRAWRLDLENAILFYDPNNELKTQKEKELTLIRHQATVVKHYTELQSLNDYPLKVRKLIQRLRRSRLDRLLKRLL